MIVTFFMHATIWILLAVLRNKGLKVELDTKLE